MTAVTVRMVEPDELELLQKISKETFLEAFSAANSQKNIKVYLSQSFSSEKLTEAFRNPDSAFYFACLDRRTVGYLKLNFGQAQTEIQADNAVEIERIYVLKEFLGKKVGQALYEKSIEIAMQKHADYIWLGVWEKNLRAIAFYKKNGFVAFDTHVFKLGDEDQTDIMMKCAINHR